jgi:hypothetical protein
MSKTHSVPTIKFCVSEKQKQCTRFLLHANGWKIKRYPALELLWSDSKEYVTFNLTGTFLNQNKNQNSLANKYRVDEHI